MATSQMPLTSTPGATNGSAHTQGDVLRGGNVVLSNADFSVVGTRPIRHDGVDKVTGRAGYGADVKLPGLLHGRVVRSPHAHARIIRIDASHALALRGVKAVVTDADLPASGDKQVDLGDGGGYVKWMQDNVLAAGMALYKGHAIAAVVRLGPCRSKQQPKATARKTATPPHRLTLKELAAKLDKTGGPITGRGNVDPKGQGGAFATNIVNVEIDPQTGKTQIPRYTDVQDAGKATHPSCVEGQMHGGAAQAIGGALNEEYAMNARGEMTNASLLDYRMATCYHLPMIDTVIVEVAKPGHPFGVRGVGEVPIGPPPAAIANANAIGARLTALPMNPVAILEANGVI